MSQALYRRYRPETFADVIGQEHVTEPLMQALRTGRVNHAYLFSGPRGCGKTTSARILARCLNCEQGPTDTPCGTCDSCVALARGGSGTVDVIEIDAASHGGVDDARELRERASYGPAQSRYKIYIIDEAHMVTPQGFNALLKIVEEPPEHVKFVFATTEPEKVIGTIRSRTHHYPFRLVPPAQLQDYLGALCESEGVPVEQGVLSFVVRAGGGSVRDSLSVLDQLIAGSGEAGLTYEGAAALLGFTDAELLDATVTAIGQGDAAAAFHQVDRVIETGLDPRRFVEDLLERLRDLIICAAVPDGAAAVLRGAPADQVDRMHLQASLFGAGGLSRAADVVNAGLTEMTGATAPRLQLELIIARLLLPGAAGPSGYAARLDRLERRLDLGGAPAAAAQPESRPGAPTPPTQSAPTQSLSAQSGPPQNAPAQGGVPHEGQPSSGEHTPSQPTPAQQPPRESRTQQPAQETSAQQPSAQPLASPPPADVTEPPRQSAASGMDQAAIVRAWPDIVDWLSRNKRVTWAFVSQNAKPLHFDGTRLIVEITTVGLADAFRRGTHAAFVREALMEVLGIDAKIEAVVAGGGPNGDGGGPGNGGGAPITTPAAVSGREPAQQHQPPPAAPQRPRPPQQSAPSPQSGQPQHAPPSGQPPVAGSAPIGGGTAAGGGAAAGDGTTAGGSAPAGGGAAAGGGAQVPGASPGGSSRPPSAPGPDLAVQLGVSSSQPGQGREWGSAAAAAASAPDWATEGDDPVEQTGGQGLATVTPIRRGQPGNDASGGPSSAAPPAQAAPPHEVVDDPDAMSDDDEDVEATGEVGRAVVERLLGGQVISEDDE